MDITEISDKKQLVINEVITNKRLIADVAAEYQVARRTVYKWLKDQKTSPAKRIEKLNQQMNQLQQEMQTLYQQQQ